MQSVHILRDQREVIAKSLLEPGDRGVRGVGLRATTRTAPVEIPAPDFQWHPLEVRLRGHLLRVVLGRPDGPVPLLPPKSRDAAFGRDPRTGQDDDPATPAFVEQGFEGGIERRGLIPVI